MRMCGISSLRKLVYVTSEKKQVNIRKNVLNSKPGQKKKNGNEGNLKQKEA